MDNQSCGDTESLIGSPKLNRQNVNENNLNVNVIENNSHSTQMNGGSNLNNASSPSLLNENQNQTLQNNQGNNNMNKMESLSSNNNSNSSSNNNKTPLRSPQIIPPTNDHQVLKVTIHKDANGYGMKVSGDNPVFVESVKAGGAAQKAGLMANDMILKVNGVEVRSEKHTAVVGLIKSSVQVDLTVKRSLKMTRPTSLGIHQQSSFSIGSNRDRAITTPQPVDANTQKSIEFNKLKTLQMMLAQEIKALDDLRSSNSSNDRGEKSKIEANIKKLKEQLRQIGGEDAVRQCLPTKIPTMTPISNNSNFVNNFSPSPSQNILQNQQQMQATPTTHHTNPALLSLFPRSLSSLSLGTKKLSKENEISPLASSQRAQQQSALNISSSKQKTPTKKQLKKEESRLAKENAQNLKNIRKEETSSSPPPPLPQRNIPRKSLEVFEPPVVPPPNEANKRKSKSSKTKALSDPKMSTQMFLQMEAGNVNEEDETCIPPPLPPRQIGMMEEPKHLDNINRGMRPSQSSSETLLSYNMNPMQQFASSNNNKGTNSGQKPSPSSSNSKHRRAISSPDNLQQKINSDLQMDRHNNGKSGSWERKDNATPPGTPPPPYPSSGNLSQTNAGMEEIDNFILHDPGTRFGSPLRQVFGNQIPATQPETIQKEIISMEDEDISDDQDLVVDEHGPFNYLQRLLEQENIAHLAVFLNYVLSNSDPEPLLFYLITGNLYKEGSVKDMRKWAYEIHSTFLVPNAPMAWFTADENIIREVDNVLQNEFDKAEILRKIFWKSRKKAKEHICGQLIDFQQKRNAGLGTIYGPSDMELNDARGDKIKEQRIFEETLVRKLQVLVDEIEKEAPEEDPKKIALSSALSTVLNRMFITRSNPGSPIAKLNNFVSREKSFKKIMGKNRKQNVRGHSLMLHQYHEVTHCNNCHGIIWGISPQGYHCTDCRQDFHRNCIKKLEEDCPGPVPQMRKEQMGMIAKHLEKHTDSKIGKLMGKIRSSHHNTSNERRSMLDKSNQASEEIPEPENTTMSPLATSHDVNDVNRGAESSFNTSIGSSNIDGAHSEIGISPLSKNDMTVIDAQHHRSSKRGEKPISTSAPHSVIRSESYKERLSHKRNRPNRRKTSDPSLSKTNDEMSGILGLERCSASSTSTSSMSSGRESFQNSPSMSMEQMGIQNHHPMHVTESHMNIEIMPGGKNQPLRMQISEEYIDYDVDEDIEDWSANIDHEILANLSEHEKKRQEIINELYQSERSHNRTLRLLEGIFYRPLLRSNVLPQDHLHLLFPPVLLQLKELHGSFEAKLKIRRLEHKNYVEKIGDILVDMFEGQTGDNLRDYAAQFCSRQQFALKALKEKRAKDEHLHRFLAKQESHKACRRLQLKDLLPAVLQRLTKYPLLFENLYKIQSKYYADDILELEAIQKAVESSKKILVDVNQAVQEAEDAHKLETIQRKLDRSSFDKETNYEYKNLDLTKMKLVHDGQLAMKKNPSVQIHGLLFENIMVLLQKHDDKYILKFFPSNTATATNDNSKGISPIIYFDHQTYVRQSAVDKNTFFLLVTKTSQMLELRAPSSSECKAWYKQISDIADKHTAHNQRSKVPPVHYDVTEDITSNNSNLHHHSTTASRDTLHESTPEWIASHSVVNNSSTNNNLNNSNSKMDDKINTKGDDSNINNNINTSIDEDEEQPLVMLGARNKIEHEYENDDEIKEVVNEHKQNIYENEIKTIPSTIQPLIPSTEHLERLRQLDSIIEEALAEKQKIVCDMYRIPNEHFAAIADIASQPEAPKDSSDIILAAFSQVQSLTSILTEYIKKPQNNLVICNKCHLCPPEFEPKKPENIKNNAGNTEETKKLDEEKEKTEAEMKTDNEENHKIETEVEKQKDDQGNKEINVEIIEEHREHIENSILNEDNTQILETEIIIEESEINTEIIKEENISESTAKLEKSNDETDLISQDAILQEDDGYCEIDRLRLPSSGFEEQQQEPPKLPEPSRKISQPNNNLNSEIPPATDRTNTKNNNKIKNNGAIPKNKSFRSNTKDVSAIKNPPLDSNTDCANQKSKLFGPLYKIPIPPLEPSIPCSAIYEIVLALNSQISLLLQKINENDQERDKYRKESNKLREIINQMIEQQRIAMEKMSDHRSNSSSELHAQITSEENEK